MSLSPSILLLVNEKFNFFNFNAFATYVTQLSDYFITRSLFNLKPIKTFFHHLRAQQTCNEALLRLSQKWAIQ